MTFTIPAIGTPERNAAEERAMARGRELLHEHEGRIRDALYWLGEELRDELRGDDATVPGAEYVREYSRALVRHAEQCWATAILR